MINVLPTNTRGIYDWNSKMSDKKEEYFLIKPYCRGCGKPKLSRWVGLNQTIGGLLGRSETFIQEYLCVKCMVKITFRFNLVMLFLGWLSIGSFVRTPIYFFSNIFTTLCSFFKLNKQRKLDDSVGRL